MSVKTQIYLRHAEDAVMSAEAGADFVGLVSDGLGLIPDSLDYESARAIFAPLPGHVMRVALSVVPEVGPTLEMIRAVKPDVVHLAGKPLTVEEVLELRMAEPTVKIIAPNT